MSEVNHEDVYGLGNTPETATTNEMAKTGVGYPARTVDGDLVNIVSKEARTEGGQLLTDDSGKTWVLRTDDGVLMPTNGNGEIADEYVDRPLPTNEAVGDATFEDGRVPDGRSPEREAA